MHIFMDLCLKVYTIYLYHEGELNMLGICGTQLSCFDSLTAFTSVHLCQRAKSSFGRF